MIEVTCSQRNIEAVDIHQAYGKGGPIRMRFLSHGIRVVHTYSSLTIHWNLMIATVAERYIS